MNIKALSLSVLFFPAVLAAQTFHVTDLSPVCAPTAINDSGAVTLACGPTGAAVWRNGQTVSLGTLTGGTYASPTAINSFGTVVGDGDTGDGRPHAFVSTAGHLLDIDPTGGSNMRTVGIMDNGVIFGNLTKSLSGNTSSWQVVMWTADPGHPGRYKENFLPKYPGGDQKANGVYAWASNKSGQVVGWVTTSIIGQLGGFWNNDATHSVVALQALPDGNHSLAWAINDLGQAAGESNTLTSYSRAVMWQNDAAHSVVDLGTLPGDSESSASGINTAGQVIGSSRTSFNSGISRAFFYQNGTMQELATLIDPADGTWTLDRAIAINNAGQIVVSGTSSGVNTYLLLTPVAP